MLALAVFNIDIVFLLEVFSRNRVTRKVQTPNFSCRNHSTNNIISLSCFKVYLTITGL